MKFLTKTPYSEILKKGLTYKKGNSNSNRKLLKLLLDEQKSFCAYTEVFIRQDNKNEFPESLDVEHFTHRLKNTEDDSYYNWYAVLHKINISKQDEKYSSSTFHETRFFQDRKRLESRIEYDPEDNLYFEKDINDSEAREFIDFIQIDSHKVASRRKAHLEKLKDIRNRFKSEEDFIHFLLNHPQELNYITAIEKTFNIDLESHL